MITEDIVAAVQGRFLKTNHVGGASNKGWIVISGHARRVKVAQALQYRQRRLGEGPCCRRQRTAIVPSSNYGPSSTAFLYHNGGRGSFATSCVVSSGSAPSSALDCDMAPEEIVSMPYAASTKSEPSRLFPPEAVGSNVSLSVDPTTVMSYGMRGTPTDKTEHSFDPCIGNEPVHVSNDELLWALGYPSNACSDGEDLDDNCSIGYTRDEYERHMSVTTPDESKSCSLMQSRAPVSPDHDSRLMLKRALHNGARRSSYALPVMVPSAAPAMPDIDIFSALEQAGFLENTDGSEQ
jgi:hypothetical protein